MVLGVVFYLAMIVIVSRQIEGSRKATDRFVTALVTGAFVVAMAPLLSLLFTVLVNGSARFDIEFFSSSMRRGSLSSPGLSAITAAAYSGRSASLGGMATVPAG